MLVLGRKAGQSIQVGGVVKITITELNGGQVKIGFEAPDEIKIVRTELLKTGDKS
jgi:carbon storage regulator